MKSDKNTSANALNHLPVELPRVNVFVQCMKSPPWMRRRRRRRKRRREELNLHTQNDEPHVYDSAGMRALMKNCASVDSRA